MFSPEDFDHDIQHSPISTEELYRRAMQMRLADPDIVVDESSLLFPFRELVTASQALKRKFSDQIAQEAATREGIWRHVAYGYLVLFDGLDALIHEGRLPDKASVIAEIRSMTQRIVDELRQYLKVQQPPTSVDDFRDDMPSVDKELFQIYVLAKKLLAENS